MTIDELKEAFGQKEVNDDIWMELIKEVDANSDGKVHISLVFSMFSLYYLDFLQRIQRNDVEAPLVQFFVSHI